MKQTISTILLALAIAAPASAEFDTDNLPKDLRTRTESFLKTETAKARAGMAEFTDEELQKIANSFKKGHDKRDQRIFWLVEEYYRRNAERASAERIRYLYLAVLAALAIITGFSFMTYRATGRKGGEPPAPRLPQPIPEPAERVITTRKPSAKKNKRRGSR